MSLRILANPFAIGSWCSFKPHFDKLLALLSLVLFPVLPRWRAS